MPVEHGLERSVGRRPPGGKTIMPNSLVSWSGIFHFRLHPHKPPKQVDSSLMAKGGTLTIGNPSAPSRVGKAVWTACTVVSSLVALFALHFYRLPSSILRDHLHKLLGEATAASSPSSSISAPVVTPYPRFPLPDDPFNFIPCTDTLSLPPLHDSDAKATWGSLFDPNPNHWSWGDHVIGDNGEDNDDIQQEDKHDPYAGRGIYLCGYLDLPLDYLNDSDARIVRLAVTKFQVSGLGRINSSAGTKSERTIVIEPGGPGASGTLEVWKAAETVTKRFSDGRFDVLGWDPRGVNASLPLAACFPHDVGRERWSLLRGQYREPLKEHSRKQLEIADAMNNATFYACQQRLGDFGRFVGTASVARDLEEIRKTLDEKQLTAYFVSYGTGIGQIYANMFPDHVGRMVLDGPEYVKDHRQLGGWGWTSLDNVTDIWRDGFLGECVKAGEQNCVLAKPTESHQGKVVTREELEARMSTLLDSILARPALGYTEVNGPSLVTYPELVLAIYISLYDPIRWPPLAQMLYELEAGNSTLASTLLEQQREFDPSLSCPPAEKLSSAELTPLVICADAYDAPVPDEGLTWWNQLWRNMTDQSWIAGNSRFLNVLPCRHFTTYWSTSAEVYRGDLNHSLSNPVLLVASPYDPATPLRNGKRLFEEMGPKNARLVIHHGYGHTSRVHSSDCTDSIGKAYILNGTVPDERETDCYTDKQPYRV